MDWTNKNEVIEKVKRSAIALQKATLFQDDYDVVYAAVSQCGMAIKYASNRLKQNRELAQIAISNFPKALIDVPYFHSDIEMIACAYEQDDTILKYLELNGYQKSQLHLYLYANQKEMEK